MICIKYLLIRPKKLLFSNSECLKLFYAVRPLIREMTLNWWFASIIWFDNEVIRISLSWSLWRSSTALRNLSSILLPLFTLSFCSSPADALSLQRSAWKQTSPHIFCPFAAAAIALGLASSYSRSSSLYFQHQPPRPLTWSTSDKPEHNLDTPFYLLRKASCQWKKQPSESAALLDRAKWQHRYLLQTFELENIRLVGLLKRVSMMILISGGKLFPAIQFLSFLQPKIANFIRMPLHFHETLMRLIKYFFFRQYNLHIPIAFTTINLSNNF